MRFRSTLFFLLLLTSSAHSLTANPSTTHPPDIVWQLNLDKGRPADYQLQFTRVVAGDNRQAFLEADTRNDKNVWHSCVTLPKGLLAAGADYYVTVDYVVIDRPDQGSYFYIFGRSASLGYGADQWLKWRGEPGARGTAKLRISPTAGDYNLFAGICGRGALRINSIKVMHGNGWAMIPLTGGGVVGKALPPPPTGAQPFTVDPPANAGGPVVNLADFGAVADGNLAPLPGADRNLAAFKAALVKCRAVKASKLIVPKGIYRITSGETILFDSLTDFIFDGGGSTFLFYQTKGTAGMQIERCHRCIFRNFNIDWDWNIDPLASVGRVLRTGPNNSFFEMHFETPATRDPRRWVTLNPLDEKLRAPGTGQELGGFNPKKIDSIDRYTVRVWPSYPVPAKVGQLYLLRHYVYARHCIVMASNTHLSLQYVTVYSFPGIGFFVGGDQHHFELLHCRITYPESGHRCITTTSDGFHIAQSQGFIRLEDCDFGYMGDDCINIHDNIHSGVRRLDDHTLVAEKLVPWVCPFTAGDAVEIRNWDYSPMGFTGHLKEARPDYKNSTVTLVFAEALPDNIANDAILFDHRYGSRNVIIRNCSFHENRARAILCNTADWLIEDNRFFHDQFSAILLIADIGGSWEEGFGAKNVIIRNNSFDSLNAIGANDGAVIALGATNYGCASPYPYVQDILLEGNTFRETTGPAVIAMSFQNLVVRGNTIVNSRAAPLLLKMRGSVRAEFGRGLWLEGNKFMTAPTFEAPALYYDAATVVGVE